MGNNALYDIWTDGSYRKRKVGAGWIVRHGGAEREGHNCIPELKGKDDPRGSDISEVFAVACALRAIPAGADVRLRLDCQNVCDWLNRGALPKASMEIPTLAMLFDEVMTMKEWMNSFAVTQASGRGSAPLNRVHKLSQIASNAHRR